MQFVRLRKQDNINWLNTLEISELELNTQFNMLSLFPSASV